MHCRAVCVGCHLRLAVAPQICILCIILLPRFIHTLPCGICNSSSPLHCRTIASATSFRCTDTSTFGICISSSPRFGLTSRRHRRCYFVASLNRQVVSTPRHLVPLSRERERECVCVWERERERERSCDTRTGTGRGRGFLFNNSLKFQIGL